MGTSGIQHTRILEVLIAELEEGIGFPQSLNKIKNSFVQFLSLPFQTRK